MTLSIVVRRLDPAEAEIAFFADGVTGRIMGPRCRYATTVEVAYPLKPIPGGARAIVPEPSMWDPETPFTYTAILNLGGETIRRRIGLRTVALGPSGLRVNRRTFRIEGIRRTSLADASALRAIGIDTILCPVSPGTLEVWNDADELGFFVIGEVPADAESLSCAKELASRPSSLGWILDVDLTDPQDLARSGTLLGWKGNAPPSWAQFVAGSRPDDRLPWLAIDSSDETPGTFGSIRV